MREARGDRARRLAERQAEQHEADDHEGRHTDLAHAQQLRREAAIDRNGGRRDAEHRTPAEAIRGITRRDDGADADDSADHFGGQEACRIFGGEQRHPRQREHRDHVEEREARERREGADHDLPAVRLDRRGDARGLELERGKCIGIIRRHDDAQTGEQRHHVERERHEEGIAPAPIEEIGRRQADEEESEQPARHDEAERRADLRDHRIPAALLVGYVHRQQRGEAVPGTAQRHTLPDPEPAQEEGGEGTDLAIGRQKGDRYSRSTEQEQGDGELGAAAEFAVDRQEDQGPDRARNEGEREDYERVERAGQPIDIREDRRREDQHRGDRIDEEVEEFRRPADDNADRDLAGANMMVAPRIHGAGIMLQRGR